MPDQNQEVFVIALIGTAIGLLLFVFIFMIFFLYQRKKQRQEKELKAIKQQYEQELLRSQLEIQESTMKTIAQELHDNIGQVLSVIKLWMSILPVEKDHAAYEGVQNSREMLNKVIYDLSDLTKSLHTDRIAEIGLTEAIRFDVESLKKTGLVKMDFTSSGNEYHFSEQKAIFLFRMYQEMMNNILKHSKATEVAVSILYSPDHNFILNVEDNGIGFDPDEKREHVSSGSGLGLKSMKNRAKLIGADFIIDSQPKKGTRISVQLPLNSNPAGYPHL